MGYNAPMMRVLMVSKALVIGAYQRKAEEIARLGVELTVLAPPVWHDRRGRQEAKPVHTAGYMFRTMPIRFNGNFHLHHYPTLAREMDALQPDVLHMDEEPYNLATWLALRAAAARRVPATFFTWQNLDRRYPFPFSRFEQDNYRRTPIAIAGNQDAAGVLRAKGYGGTIAVIPQFGVDPAIFSPADTDAGREAAQPFRIGYAGGLLPEKGLDDLLRACATLDGAWELALAGEGEAQPALAALAAELGISDRVRFAGRAESTAMPAFYRSLDAVVLPSRTTSGWKEQFGRVLVEAMACQAPVVGSDSGEIPTVIGDAGLIFPEGDVAEMARHLHALMDDPALRRRLGAAGRQRVLARFTMARIAAETVAVYAALAGRTP